MGLDSPGYMIHNCNFYARATHRCHVVGVFAVLLHFHALHDSAIGLNGCLSAK